MKGKKILVKDILNLMEGTDEVNVQLYAYGVFYGQSSADGLNTVEQVKEKMIYDGLNARVGRIRVDEHGHLSIGAEMVHD